MTTEGSGGGPKGNIDDLREIQHALKTGLYFDMVPLKPETVERLRAQEKEILLRQGGSSESGTNQQA